MRLWLEAYGKNQPEERKRAMGAAIVRYLTAVNLRRGGSDGPLEPIDPVSRVDPLD